MSIWIVFTNVQSQSYGSSEVTSQNDTTPAFLKADGDCFAWKFYLLTAIYDIVYRGVSKEVYARTRENFDPSIHYNFPNINIYEALPPQTAKKIINTIIKREGGHCNKQVLYEIPRCTYDSNIKIRSKVERISHRFKDIIYHVEFFDMIDFDYFSKATDFPINKKLVSQYEHFLREHLIEKQYPDFNDFDLHRYILLSCDEKCNNNDFYFRHYNVFGSCMIAKHYKHLKNYDIFDFKDYLHGILNNPIATLNINSLENFIKKSDEVVKKSNGK